MKTLVILLFSLFAVSRIQGQEPRLDALSQQKTCAHLAGLLFRASDASNDSPQHLEDEKTGAPPMRRAAPADYTSHYDAKVEVCYIMVHERFIISDSEGETRVDRMQVWDAIERRTYADVVSLKWVSRKDGGVLPLSPLVCSVKPRGQDEITCKSSEEFKRLVDKHFGVGF